MLTMILFTGMIVFFGTIFLFIKLPKRVSLILLGKPLLLDLTVSIIVVILHWGSFSGLMSAAFAGLLMSCFTSAARFSVGYLSTTPPKTVTFMVGKYHYSPGKVWRFYPGDFT